jgi:hypothetical protein
MAPFCLSFDSSEGIWSFEINAGFDFLQLFLVDSEILLLPPLLKQLV